MVSLLHDRLSIPVRFVKYRRTGVSPPVPVHAVMTTRLLAARVDFLASRLTAYRKHYARGPGLNLRGITALGSKIPCDR
jgi:hypothetical protein